MYDYDVVRQMCQKESRRRRMGLFSSSRYVSETITGSTDPVFGKSIDEKLEDLIDAKDREGYDFVGYYEEVANNGFLGQLKDIYRAKKSYTVTYVCKFKKR